jgi:hypothetical protein
LQVDANVPMPDHNRLLKLPDAPALATDKVLNVRSHPQSQMMVSPAPHRQ